MINVKREGILLERTDLYFENEGVLNPAIYQEGDLVHMFYRSRPSFGTSMIGYCVLEGPLKVTYRSSQPLIVPEYAYEAYGVEDPRIVKIDGCWHLTYTAFDGQYALGALATSTDLRSFTKQGIIVPRMTYKDFYQVANRNRVDQRYFSYKDVEHLWNKNVTFFPRRIGGKLFFLHRIRPGILIAETNELSDLNRNFWACFFANFSKNIVLDPLYKHEYVFIGAGCPPIETHAGWLVIYHGIEEIPGGYIYNACAALLDLDNPYKVIARLPFPLFGPEEPCERVGRVNDVVFPSGTSLFEDRLYIYYGGADVRICVASIALDELLHELLKNP